MTQEIPLPLSDARKGMEVFFRRLEKVIRVALIPWIIGNGLPLKMGQRSGCERMSGERPFSISRPARPPCRGASLP